jgi:hypothetical protein
MADTVLPTRDTGRLLPAWEQAQPQLTMVNIHQLNECVSNPT